MSTGYANRVRTLDFPELSSDPENDPIRVVIRNPQLMSPDELTPKNVEVDANGNPLVAEDAEREGREVIARLIIGWRVYDATTPITVDLNGDIVDEQVLLPQVFNVETLAKLPLAIIRRISDEMNEAINPQ